MKVHTHPSFIFSVDSHSDSENEAIFEDKSKKLKKKKLVSKLEKVNLNKNLDKVLEMEDKNRVKKLEKRYKDNKKKLGEVEILVMKYEDMIFEMKEELKEHERVKAENSQFQAEFIHKKYVLFLLPF